MNSILRRTAYGVTALLLIGFAWFAAQATVHPDLSGNVRSAISCLFAGGILFIILATGEDH